MCPVFFMPESKIVHSSNDNILAAMQTKDTGEYAAVQSPLCSKTLRNSNNIYCNTINFT